MSRPSEKALAIAEELIDYAHHGMTRAAAVHEIAAMVDEMNADLVEVATALVNEAETNGAGRHVVLINHLREILLNYKPLRCDAEAQHELFSAETHTATETAPAAAPEGQMP